MKSNATTDADTQRANIDSATRDLTRFVLTSYAITWLLLGPWFYFYNLVWKRHLPAWAWLIVPFAFLGGYGPSLAALLMARRNRGGDGIPALLRSLTRWRVRIGWYFFVLLAPLAVAALAAIISPLRPVVLETFRIAASLASAPAVLLLALPFGPLGEELGWRGYALPRLLQKQGIWLASLTLGAIWALWHAPMIALMPGAALPSFMPVSWYSVGLYLLQITAIGGVMTVVYCATRGSVLLTLLLHLTFNTSDTIFYYGLGEVKREHLQQVYAINVMLLAALAIAMLAWLQKSLASRAAGPPA